MSSLVTERYHRHLGARVADRRLSCFWSLIHFLFQAKSLDRDYKLLGVMLAQNRNFTEELSKYKSLRGFTDNNKRLRYVLDGPEVKKVYHPVIYILP